MAFKDYFKGAIQNTIKYIPSTFGLVDNQSNNSVEEQFKGKVIRKKVKFPAELGEEHPFDFPDMQNVFLTVGFVQGIIEKYVDFIWGSGFFVESEDERAKQIIEDWMRDVDFSTLGRTWIREALVKGNGFLELGGAKDETVDGAKVLNANWMYIERDEFGEVENYNQFIGEFGKFGQEKATIFKPFQIAHLSFNMIGDSPYGYGVVFPMLDYVDNLLLAQRESHILLKRKAGSPYDVKVGNEKWQPTQGELDSITAKFSFLNNKTEWIHGPDVEIKTLDFGNIGDKFETIFAHDEKMMFFASQVPAMLMGEANISEGQGDVQMEGFKLRVGSLQAEIEKVIENKIFRRVLQSNNIDSHVEFQWGQATSKEKNDRLTLLLEYLKLFELNSVLRKTIELEVAKLLDFGKDKQHEIEATADEEREREEERPLPTVPGQRQREKIMRDVMANNDIGKGNLLTLKMVEDESVNEFMTIEKESFGYSLMEWLGFNYADFIREIDDFIATDSFVFIAAFNDVDIISGKLTSKEIARLKRILREGFREGSSIKDIAREINRLNLRDLKEIKNGRVTDKILVGKARRGNMLARTETTRVAFEGSLKHYAEGDVEKVRFISSRGTRTCPICEGLNGFVYTIEDAVGIIPVHTYCRCSMSPVTELG